jgi:CRP-like cAMP-binding protein
MKRRDDFLQYLTKVPLFSACNKKELAELAKYSEHMTIKAGTAVTTEGKAGHEFFTILDGKAQVNKKGVDVNVIGPGDFFGELALLDRAPRNATITAITDLEVVLLGQREFTAALDTVPTLAHKLLTGLAKRIHQVDAGVIN